MDHLKKTETERPTEKKTKSRDILKLKNIASWVAMIKKKGISNHTMPYPYLQKVSLKHIKRQEFCSSHS